MGEVVMLSSEEWMEEEQVELEMKEGSTSVIKWENFLPRMFIRVLLVEADDSTRQIISALLRKCGYRVTAVSDGSKAWDTLKVKAHTIDLVLTEVELPSISGFSLLDMIAEHESCKNIPVIMMSTHDSIGVVFNCMLKGAADFFIKPVRKNELRNLWQHVWRRHNSSSGARSLQDGNSTKQKIGVISENNSASNHTNDCVASAHNTKECSDKESDALSSSTKRDMEAESACVQKSKSPSHLHETEIEKQKECDQLDDRLPIHDSEDVVEETKREDNNIPCETKHNDSKQIAPPREAIDLIGSFDHRRQAYAAVREVFCSDSKIYSDSNDTANKLELSLKRSHPSDCGFQQTDERRTLNHSNFSAFSPYNNRTVQAFLPMLIDFHNEPEDFVDRTSEHKLKQLLANSTDAQHNTSILNNNQEILTPQVIGQPSQAATRFPCPQRGVIPNVVPVKETSFDSLCSGYGTLFTPIVYTQSCPPSLWSPNSVNHQKAAQTKPECDKYEQVHDLRDQNDESCADQIMHEQPKANEESVENQLRVTPDTNQSATSSLCNGAASNLNNSGYGSISNGNVIRAAFTRATSDCGHDEALLGHDGMRGGMDPLRSTQREMALNKFRLKRKERCFEKKVRYQSRKKLAEQRPRVKGQFVRQITTDLPLPEANC